MDAKRLAELLAQRFDAIVPDGFHVSEQDGMLEYRVDSSAALWPRGGSGSYIAENLGNGDTMEERVRWCAEEVLGQLQDSVDLASGEPWPGDRTVPRAHARVIDGKLHMWFGDAEKPVLECEPIDLTSGGEGGLG
jgi:hypothetical protein